MRTSADGDRQPADRRRTVVRYALGVVVGVGLFAATVLGALALQGRLNYDGTRGIPVLSSLFSRSEGRIPNRKEVRRQAKPAPPRSPAGTPSREPRALGALGALGAHRFDPGELFDFPKLDSGITAEQINESFRNAQHALEEAERQQATLEAFETELLARQRDLEDREQAIAMQMMRVDQERDRLDRRIKEFERDVHLIHKDELKGLRDYALTLSAFRPEKAAECVLEECKDEEGRDRIVKVLALMDHNTAADILNGVDNARVKDLLVERLKVERASR